MSDPDPPRTLDYRRPGTPSAETGDILRLLKQRDAVSTGKTIGLLLLGLAILSVMLGCVGSLIGAILFRFDVAWPMWQVYLVTAAVLVPLLFWTERRTGGRYFDDESRGFGGGANAASSYGEYQIDRAQAGVALYTELLLTGPRFVLEGVGARRRRGKVGEPLLQRAAEALRQLSEAGQGLTLKQMLRPGEEPARLHSALAHLAEQDWIGTSKDGRRAWLLDEARGRLTGV